MSLELEVAKFHNLPGHITGNDRVIPLTSPYIDNPTQLLVDNPLWNSRNLRRMSYANLAFWQEGINTCDIPSNAEFDSQYGLVLFTEYGEPKIPNDDIPAASGLAVSSFRLDKTASSTVND